MTITEPTTMATDYLLAVLAGAFAFYTWRAARRERQKSVGFWAGAFLGMSLAAAVAGTYHGFALYLTEQTRAGLWKVTIYLTGLMSFSMLAAIVLASLPRWLHRPLLGVAALKFLLYAAWMTTHNDFRYVVFDYAGSMLAVLGLQAWAAYRWREKSPPWIIGGVLVSFAGAAVQHSGLRLHGHFNHNDLYHVIQLVATCLFYRGGRLLRDR